MSGRHLRVTMEEYVVALGAHRGVCDGSYICRPGYGVLTATSGRFEEGSPLANRKIIYPSSSV